MEDTGRLRRGLTPIARRIVFDEAGIEAGISEELPSYSLIDLAHLIMLAEQGIIAVPAARLAVRTILALRATDFAPLRGRTAARGLYLLYEDHLIEELGAQVGGVLQTARSRNDLNATALKMRLRPAFASLLRPLLRLQGTLLARSRRFATITMPGYTHFQPAVPVTFGHYLAGIATALERDIDQVFAAGDGLDECPLGACAVGGTSLPIRADRTAALLGFGTPVRHSIDAVASRDVILRLLAACSIAGITLSRLSADLLVWSTEEFGFLELPDHLAGSSSMMPQKKNPFLLEVIQGRSATAHGAFISAVAAMQDRPFTNSVSVGTEAVSHVWRALRDVTAATTLAGLVVRSLRVLPDRMLRRAAEGNTSATELANRLIMDPGLSFRQAHRAVGEMVLEALERGETLEAVAVGHGVSNVAGLDPASVATAARYGAGPAAEVLLPHIDSLRRRWRDRARDLRRHTHRWRLSEDALMETARHFCK
jgi:argininosuccinate lyase